MPFEAKWPGQIPSDEELKRLDELDEKFRNQRLKIADEGKLIKVRDPLTGENSDVSSSFGHCVNEYHRLRIAVKDFMRDYDRDLSLDNETLVIGGLTTLRKTIDTLNAVYYNVLARNLVDEGYGKQLEECSQKIMTLTNKNVETENKLREAQRRIRNLEIYIRLHNGNPDDATDSFAGETQEGGEPPHE